MEQKSLFARWRTSFVAGLAVVLPGVVTFAIVKWLFGTISSFTDLLLFFLPARITHADDGAGPVYWYWSLLAIIVATLLVTFIGLLAKNYIGRRLIDLADHLILRVPLLNKIYGTIKQVDQAFSSGKKSSFQTVVLVEYPREGIYSVGFITSEQAPEIDEKTGKKCVCIFIPTTPIPTGGFLIVVPREKVIKLDMSVPEGLKYIISIGAISHERVPPPDPRARETGQRMLLHND
ncbi:MAG TPA: DUF502 domain-containing protein [Pseudomonadales bacterium]|nr:DUF502 domain-containing protein [Pseudomonadales bacterium]